MIDYQEITSRRGKTIVFCNLRTLLFERFGVNSETELQPFCNSNGEYICHCPFCEKEGHTKKKLYVRDDFSEGHCFVCTRAFINVDDQIKIDFKVPDFISETYANPLKIIPMTDNVWTLEKFNEFDKNSEIGEKYLSDRQPYLGSLIKILGFRFVGNNVAIPFYYPGIENPIYYQIRFTKKNSKIRYFFPKTPAKPPYILSPTGSRKILIVEGVFDAIAALLQSNFEYTVFAVLGSSVSEYQIQFIREYCPTEIVIYMDKTEISDGIRKRLRKTFDYCPINIIKSSGMDPEEKLVQRYKKNKPLVWITSDMFKRKSFIWDIPKLMW